MKNLISTLLFLVLMVLSVDAQETNLGNISNVDWQYDSLSKKITISYDLARVGAERYFRISVDAVIDGQPLTPSTSALEGDVGNYIRSGLSNKIIWDVTQDILFTQNASLQIKVTSKSVQPTPTPGPDPMPLPEPNLFIPIGAGVLGGGLIVAGLGNMNSDDVKEYESSCDPNSSSFNSSFVEVSGNAPSTCDLLYDEAKKDHDGGTTLSMIGVGVIVVGVGWFIKQKIDEASAIDGLRGGDDRIKVDPFYTVGSVFWPGGQIGNLGLKFTYNF